jgi:hypothetical protein
MASSLKYLPAELLFFVVHFLGEEGDINPWLKPTVGFMLFSTFTSTGATR